MQPMKNKCENCGKCCYDTKMILSSQDIDLILQNYPKDMKKDDFVFKNKNGFFQLKNREGHCIFFDLTSNVCKIYKRRPQGCKFYPLIYDFYKSKCILDEDCPRIHLFYQEHSELEFTCKKIKDFLKDQLEISFFY